ncbi:MULTISPECIES: fibronectin-binding protein [unclassified Mycobacterium]|uniref:fibronectin-binding protein n=1 Tax=unclassified Mycobacterium TaxID=2642494 RepID=UPI0029C714B6|nr:MULTISPECIES: fibronectin-binding protein [unclassified Mycobacterium]
MKLGINVLRVALVALSGMCLWTAAEARGESIEYLVVPLDALNATPADDPCPLAMSFLCGFLPIAPDLDGDVDLTKQLPPADPTAPAPDSLPPPISAPAAVSGRTTE